jgi:hypothetical protein
MLTDEQRQSTIDAIARNLQRFDDNTLAEMARLTDPEGRDVQPSPARLGADTSRRRFLAGAALGAGAMGAALLGVPRVAGMAPLTDAEAARLRRIAALGRELEAVGLDDSLTGGMTSVSAQLTSAVGAGREVDAALAELGPGMEAALAVVDPGLADRAHAQLLARLPALTAAVNATQAAWSASLETPVTEKVERRRALRGELSRLDSGSDAPPTDGGAQAPTVAAGG